MTRYRLRSGPRPTGPVGAGFTFIEIVVVLAIASIVLTIAGLSFSGYFRRSAARSAAQLFSQDLTAARSYAVRSREPVVIRFFESTLRYEIETQSTATDVVTRRFQGNADIELTAITLDLAGDSLVFDARGFADFTPGASGLGTATFSSGGTTYTVSFNAMGASKIE